MKKIILAGTLLLILLVGTVSAATVEYASKQVVPLSTSRDSAEASLINFILTGSSGSTIGSWRGATLAASPLTIYDLAGLKYIYQFDVLKGGIIIGEVNAAANKLSGKSVISLDTVPRSYNPDVVIEKIRTSAGIQYPYSRIDYVVPVIYQEQKTGIMAVVYDMSKGFTHRIIYDANSLQLVSDTISNPGLADAGSRMSVFQKISDQDALTAIRDFNSQTNSLAQSLPTLRLRLKNPYLTVPEAARPIIKPVGSGGSTSALISKFVNQTGTGPSIPGFGQYRPIVLTSGTGQPGSPGMPGFGTQRPVILPAGNGWITPRL